MNAWKFVKVYLLNLPDKEHQQAKEAELRKRYGAEAAAAQPAPVQDELGAWASASAVATQTRQRPTAAPVWTATEEKRGPKFWVVFVRGLLVTVLLLAVITGVRSWIWPNQGPEPEAVPASITFPSIAASGVAERFATAYLSWDEDTPDPRATALSAVVAGGSAGPLGWDGTGKQDVDNVHAESVQIDDQDTARVIVSGTVTPFTKAEEPDAEWVAGDPRPVAVQVKVEIINGRAVVDGRPGYVAIPEPAQIPAREVPPKDSELTTATRTNVEQFFTAYGEQEDVSALTAPDSQIVGLGGALVFSQLSSWTVYDGEGDTHEATAVVEWTSGSALIEQTYTLTLVQVTGAGSNRYQISSLSGGEL